MKHIFTKKIKARDPVTGEFEGINAFAAESTEEYLAKIQKKGEDTLSAVGAEMDAHGQRVLESLPEEYTNLVVQTTGESETQVMSQKAVTSIVSGWLPLRTELEEADFEYGAYIDANGDVTHTEKHRAACTRFIPVTANASTINIETGWKYNVGVYTPNRTLYTHNSYRTSKFVSPIDGFIRFTLSKVDDSAFAISEAINAVSMLQQNGKVADWEPVVDEVSDWLQESIVLYIDNFVYNKYIDSSGIMADTESAKLAYKIRVFITSGTTIFVEDGWEFNYATYDSASGELVKDYRSYSSEPFIATDDCYIRFTIKKADDSEFEIQEGANAVSVVQKNGRLEQLEANVTKIAEEVVVPKSETIGAFYTSPNWKIGAGGVGVQDTAYMIRKYSVVPGQKIHIKASKDAEVVYQWQTSETVPSSNNTFIIEEPVLTEVDDVVIVPNRAKYLMIAQLKTNAENMVKLITEENRVTSNSDDIRLLSIGLHKKPYNSGVLNAIKRARQLSDIEWTPISDVERISILTGDTYEHSTVFKDVFKANEQYVGIPYTNASFHATRYGYDRMFIGYIPLETFASAVRAGNSVVGKESFYDAANNGTFYGNICSSFVTYVLGLEPCFTSNFIRIAGMTNKGKLLTNGARFDVYSLELADVIIYPGEHVAIITDIISDENGEVKIIEVSETTKYGNANSSIKGSTVGSLTRRKGWTVDEFFNWFKAYSVYRYEKIGDVQYEFSPYSPMKDELDMKPTVDFPCMPYMGNKFVYRKGYIPNSDLLVLCSGFNYVKVFKDGNAFNSDGTQNPYPISGDTVTIGFAETGFYEAYLCNITDGIETLRSLSCQWRVSDADIAISKGDGNVTFTITTDGNDIPKAVGFTSNGSYPEYPWNELNFDDMDDMNVSENENGTYTYTFTLEEPTWAGSYLKVAFKNNYGIWHSDRKTY